MRIVRNRTWRCLFYEWSFLIVFLSIFHKHMWLFHKIIICIIIALFQPMFYNIRIINNRRCRSVLRISNRATHAFTYYLLLVTWNLIFCLDIFGDLFFPQTRYGKSIVDLITCSILLSRKMHTSAETKSYILSTLSWLNIKMVEHKMW